MHVHLPPLAVAAGLPAFRLLWMRDVWLGKRKAMDAQTPDQAPAITFRIIALERDVADLKDQLNRYVPARENDLQLKSIRDAVERIEQEMQEARKQLESLNHKLILQEREAQERDAAQRESQATLQIKVLWGTVSTAIAVLAGVLIGYITHLFR